MFTPGELETALIQKNVVKIDAMRLCNMEEQFFKIINQAIREINEDLEYAHLRNVTRETEIFGGENSIDSISLAGLITEIEFLIREKLTLNVVLADEKALSMKNSPYRNVETLLNFIMGKLEDENG